MECPHWRQSDCVLHDLVLSSENQAAWGCTSVKVPHDPLKMNNNRNFILKRPTFQNLMRRISKAGLKKDFVRRAILPDWWDDSCDDQPDLLPEIEIRVARYFGVSLAAVKDSGSALIVPQYANAQLRRVRDVNKDRLAPAIHAALRIGAAVVRSARDLKAIPLDLPTDALTWREQIRHEQGPVKFDQLLDDLWGRGIPVVPVDILPTPNFQGIACIIEGRPVILLGHRHDELSRVAFIVAHEVGHIAAYDCVPDKPVVDQEDEVVDAHGDVVDDTEIESKADH